jgi:drug/metabolite transporter (DMT)-like permease
MASTTPEPSHGKGVFLGYAALIGMGLGITVVQAIPVDPTALVFYRCLVAAPVMWVIMRFRSVSWQIRAEDWLPLVLIALMTGMHWISLFISIRLGTVALAMVSLYTYPIFSTLIEALVQRRRPRPVDLALAFLTLLGVILLTPLSGAPPGFLWPVLVGIFSAVCWSGRLVMIHHRMRAYDSGSLMFWNLLIIGLLLLPVGVLRSQPLDWDVLTIGKVLFLGVFVTALCHTLVLMSLRHISATLFSQIGPVQILAAAVAGWIFLGESVTPRLIAGGLAISLAGLAASWTHRLPRTGKPPAHEKVADTG